MSSRALILIIVLALLAGGATAYQPEDIEWVSKGTSTMKWGDTKTVGDYTVEVFDFDMNNRAVYVKIREDGELLEEGMLDPTGDSELVYDDEFKVIANSVTVTEPEWTSDKKKAEATLAFYLRGKPKLKITIDPSVDEMDPQRQFTTTIKVKNTGDARVEDVAVDVNVGEFERITGDYHHEYDVLEKNEEQSFELKLRAPTVPLETKIPIEVTASGVDVKALEYDSSATKKLTVRSMITLDKTVATPDSEYYLGDIIPVNLAIRNKGASDLTGVKLVDEGTTELEMLDSASWTFDLESRDTRGFHYTVKPIKPGTYTVGRATATFQYEGKTYTINSSTVKVKVHGPWPRITKTVSPDTINPGDTVTVTVKVENTGDATAGVNVSDHLPENATLTDGTLELDTVILKPGKTRSYTYKMRVNGSPGEITLPAATGTFADMQDYTGTTLSNQPRITIKSQTSNNNGGSSGSTDSGSDSPSGEWPSDTPPEEEKVTPGFTSLIGLLVLFLLAYRMR